MRKEGDVENSHHHSDASSGLKDPFEISKIMKSHDASTGAKTRSATTFTQPQKTKQKLCGYTKTQTNTPAHAHTSTTPADSLRTTHQPTYTHTHSQPLDHIDTSIRTSRSQTAGTSGWYPASTRAGPQSIRRRSPARQRTDGRTCAEVCVCGGSCMFKKATKKT